MLLENNPIENSRIGYQFCFNADVDRVSFRTICTDSKCVLSSVAHGCYYATDNKLDTCRRNKGKRYIDESDIKNVDTLTLYRKNVQRRVRSNFRDQRDVFTIELSTILVKELSINIKQQTITNVYLKGLVTLQKIGVAVVSLWFENYTPQDENGWREIRDPNLVLIETADVIFGKKDWNLIDFVKSLATEVKSICAISVDDDAIIESHPFFYLQYDLDSSSLREKINTTGKDLRLILNGDMHWKFKSERTFEKTIKQDDLSSRDSIIWLISTEGMVKIASNQLETSVDESLLTAIVEMEIVLTMKFFLINLSHKLSNLSNGQLSPTALADMRHKIFDDMNDYFNIDVSHNDQTQKRIRTLKNIFSIDYLYQSIMDRFEMLGTKLAYKNSERIEKNQNSVAIIFGFFGSVGVLFQFFYSLFGSLNTKLTAVGVSLLSGALALVISTAIVAGLYFLIKGRKTKGGKKK